MRLKVGTVYSYTYKDKRKKTRTGTCTVTNLTADKVCFIDKISGIEFIQPIDKVQFKK